MNNDNKIPDIYLKYEKLCKQIKEEKDNLQQKRVPVYKIVNQFYCEKQVEIKEKYGEMQNKAIINGKIGHCADLPFLKSQKTVTLWVEATIESRSEPINIREFHLLTKYNNFYIEGKVDEISFLQGKALNLVEYKFRDNLRIYDDDKLQCYLYAFILKRMGFNTKNLQIQIKCFKAKDRQYALLFKNSVDKFEHKEINIDKIDYNKVKENINWALEFWKNNRTAIPTNIKGKCQVCNYKKYCEI